jgi:hypothetical protein
MQREARIFAASVSDQNIRLFAPANLHLYIVYVSAFSFPQPDFPLRKPQWEYRSKRLNESMG